MSTSSTPSWKVPPGVDAPFMAVNPQKSYQTALASIKAYMKQRREQSLNGCYGSSKFIWIQSRSKEQAIKHEGWVIPFKYIN